MKTCNKCNKQKSLSEFAWRNKSKGTTQPYCKRCRKEMDAESYQNTTRKADIAANRKGQKDRNLVYVRDYLSTHPCVDCGMDDIRVLDFDHLQDKEANVTVLARSGVSLQRLQTEIDKCEIRCSNHHRIKTYERAGWDYYNMPL